MLGKEKADGHLREEPGEEPEEPEDAPESANSATKA